MGVWEEFIRRNNQPESSEKSWRHFIFPPIKHILYFINVKNVTYRMSMKQRDQLAYFVSLKSNTWQWWILALLHFILSLFKILNVSSNKNWFTAFLIAITFAEHNGCEAIECSWYGRQTRYGLLLFWNKISILYIT